MVRAELSNGESGRRGCRRENGGQGWVIGVWWAIVCDGSQWEILSWGVAWSDVCLLNVVLRAQWKTDLAAGRFFN